MRSTTFPKQRNSASARTGYCASLSVVVVSSGSALVAQRATQALKSASQGFTAQFILVSQDEDPCSCPGRARGAEFVVAPPGCTRAEMCDLGMSRASGSIVAVRDDVAVGDARWLATYRAVLPPHDAAPPLSSPIESVVMDTLVAGRVGLADGAPSFATLESKARAAAIEMAAAV
jgi:hypothetical protein